MNTQVIISDNKSNTETSTKFHHFVGGFRIDLPCIICESESKTVYVQDQYDLIDFLNNGGIVATKVKFIDAYLTGYKVTIVVLYTKTGEIIKRSHRINNDELVCDWVLTDLFTKPRVQ